MDNYAAHRDRSLRGIIDSSKMLLEEGDKQWRFVVEGKASKCGGIYVYYMQFKTKKNLANQGMRV